MITKIDPLVEPGQFTRENLDNGALLTLMIHHRDREMAAREIVNAVRGWMRLRHSDPARAEPFLPEVLAAINDPAYDPYPRRSDKAKADAKK